jgi:hypothetical protein
MTSGVPERRKLPVDGIPTWMKLVAGLPILLLLTLTIAIFLIALAKLGHWIFFWIVLVFEVYFVFATALIWSRQRRQRGQ